MMRIYLSHTRDVSVEIYHTEFIDPFIARKKYHTVLFLFSHIAENFDITFRKWIEAEDVLREVIALYISVVDSPSMYLQIQFQLVIYALEAYHRRTTANQDNNLQEHNKKISDILRSCPPEYEDWLHEKLKYSYEPNLRHSLNELISKYELIFSRFVSDKKGDFVNKVVNTRNYLTHYDQDLRHKAITDMDILHEVTQKLIGLLQVCLLIQVASVEEVKVMYKIEG